MQSFEASKHGDSIRSNRFAALIVAQPVPQLLFGWNQVFLGRRRLGEFGFRMILGQREELESERIFERFASKIGCDRRKCLLEIRYRLALTTVAI